MSSLPNILVIGFHQCKAERIIELITKTGTSDTVSLQDGVLAHKWQINNKYYQADVNLCSSDHKTSLTEDFKQTVEAVILYVDITKDNFIADLDQWLNNVKNCHISENVLLCETSENLNEIEKEAVNDWCIRHEYELIELEPKVTECDDSFPEVFGIDRVNEVLHSHIWPNLKKNEILHHVKYDEEISSDIKSAGKSICENDNDSNTEEKEFDNMEQLAQLFQNLQSMKNELSSLTTEQKLDQAEKVVKAFWNAIGGDAAEFSESDENDNFT